MWESLVSQVILFALEQKFQFGGNINSTSLRKINEVSIYVVYRGHAVLRSKRKQKLRKIKLALLSLIQIYGQFTFWALFEYNLELTFISSSNIFFILCYSINLSLDHQFQTCITHRRSKAIHATCWECRCPVLEITFCCQGQLHL